MLMPAKSVKTAAKGQITTKPIKEISRLTLNAFDALECLPTKTTAKPETAAESNASTIPIMVLGDVIGGIKTNLILLKSTLARVLSLVLALRFSTALRSQLPQFSLPYFFSLTAVP